MAIAVGGPDRGRAEGHTAEKVYCCGTNHCCCSSPSSSISASLRFPPLHHFVLCSALMVVDDGCNCSTCDQLEGVPAQTSNRQTETTSFSFLSLLSLPSCTCIPRRYPRATRHTRPVPLSCRRQSIIPSKHRRSLLADIGGRRSGSPSLTRM